MKKILISLLLLVPISLNAQIRLLTVVPSTSTVTIKNFGRSTVDISGYRFCSLFNYSSNLDNGNTVNLAAGAEVVIVWQNLQSEADLGLYLPTGGFGSSTSMVDFTQWGSSGNGRETVADTKGIWTAGEFVSGTEPYSYTGDGAQNGAAFWTGVSSNNVPTNILISSSSIDENKAEGSLVGNLTTTDADAGDTHTYSLITGKASFQISGQKLQSKKVFDFEDKSSYSVQIKTDDGNGGTFSKTFSITINNKNDQPTDISISNASVEENQPIDTSIGSFSTEDEDDADEHTYTLVSGTGDSDNGDFNISSDELITNAVFDLSVQNSYSIRVKSNDGNGGSIEKKFTISVVEENLAPTDITLSALSLAENQPIGTKIVTLTDDDPNSSDQHTFSLVNGTGDTDNDDFKILGKSLKSNAKFNFEVKDNYSLRVLSDDGNGGTFEKALNITISDENDAPTDIEISDNLIMQGDPVGTLIGGLGTIDEDADDTHSYDFVTGEGDENNGLFMINGVDLFTNHVFGSSDNSQPTIRVKSTDAAGASIEKQISLSVDEVTGLRDVTVPKVKVFPNPFNQRLMIKFPSTFDQPILFNVYNLNGRLVYKNEFNSHESGEGTLIFGDLYFEKGYYLYELMLEYTQIKRGVIIKQ